MPTQLEHGLKVSSFLRYDRGHETVLEAEEDFAEMESSPEEGSDHMDVSGVGGISRAFPITPSRSAPNVSAPSVPNSLAPQDEVQLSESAKLLDQISQTPSLRQERIAEIQKAIAEGTYDTDEKLDAAINRMFNQHGL